MKKSFLAQFAATIAILTVVGFISCAGQKQTHEDETARQTVSSSDTIPYTMVNNYFINNDVDTVLEVILTESEFARYFGMAATMGEGGNPTAIDFFKQYVIVAAAPTTDIATEITPVSLKQDGDSLVFNCKVTRGEKMTYTIHPFIMIAVNTKYGTAAKVSFQ